MIIPLNESTLLIFVLYGLPNIKLSKSVYFQLRLVLHISALDKLKCLHPVNTFSSNKPTSISLSSKAETTGIHSNMKSKTNATEIK